MIKAFNGGPVLALKTAAGGPPLPVRAGPESRLFLATAPELFKAQKAAQREIRKNGPYVNTSQGPLNPLFDVNTEPSPGRFAGNTSFQGAVAAVSAAKKLNKITQKPPPTMENVKRGVAGVQGNVAGLAVQQAQRKANELKAAAKRAENLRKAQHNKGVAAAGEFIKGVEENAEIAAASKQIALQATQKARRAAENDLLNKISTMNNAKLQNATKIIMARKNFNTNRAKQIIARYTQLHRLRPKRFNAKFIINLRAEVNKPQAPPPKPINTSFLAATLARAIKAALAKPKSGAARPPKTINTRSLASTLAAAIKKALAARKATAGINTSGLVAALTAAIKKALAARKGAGPVNTSALASALARAITDALSKRKSTTTTGTQTEEPARQTRMSQEEAAPPKINKNSLVKSLTNALKRALTPSGPVNTGRQSVPPSGAPGKPGKPGAPGAPGKPGAPGAPGRNANRFLGRQAGPAGVNVKLATGATTLTGAPVSTSVTGPTITVAAPNIKIQLNGLVKATEQARADPNKMANLERTVANLKARLSNGSEAKKALNTLFPKNAPPPTPEAVKTVVNAVIAKEEAKKQAVKQVFKQVTPPPGKSLRNMSFGELLHMRRSAKNRTEINRYLRQDVEKELKKIERMSSVERGWALGQLYKSLPEGLPAKQRVARAIQAEIRRTGRERDPVEASRRLRDLYGNLSLGRRLPKEFSREFKTQNVRALTNYKREEERRARRYGYNYGGGRSLRQGREMFTRPGQQVALRQAPRFKMARPTEMALRQGGARALPSLKGPQVFAGPKALIEGVSLQLPKGIPGPVLPPNQRSAITQVGGPTQALKVVAAVPGGAPAVARAAADLNEMNGNVKKAQELKGTPSAAIKAVQKLGGHKTASYALEGLNTLAQSKKTQVRKAARVQKVRKVKKAPVRLHELNKVIEAVKRKKLVSLVTHNVGNVNNNKKKKYYKKVIKSFILKKSLANKVKAAAKKNKS
jgi:hypothetical protein